MVRPVLRLGLLLRLLLLASLLLLLLVLLVLFLHHQYHHRHFPPAVVALLVSFVILPRSSPRTPPLRRCRCRCRSRRRRAATGAAASSSYGGSPEIQMSGRIAPYLGPDEKLRFILSPGWRRASLNGLTRRRTELSDPTSQTTVPVGNQVVGVEQILTRCFILNSLGDHRAAFPILDRNRRQYVQLMLSVLSVVIGVAALAIQLYDRCRK